MPHQPPPWKKYRAKSDEKSEYEEVEIVDDDDEPDEQWGRWNHSWWKHDRDEEAREDDKDATCSSSNNKKAVTTPRRRRTATSSGGHKDGRSDHADTEPTMQFWRGMLGMQGEPAKDMQAAPPQVLEEVQRCAMATEHTQFVALLSSWSRFALLLMAEINKAIMDAHRRQQSNRQQWTKKPRKNDRPSGTPVFRGMLRWQEAFDLLPPRRRSTRAALVLEYLGGSAHAAHGSSVIGEHITAVQNLLLAMAPSQDGVVEDVDVVWSQEVWEQIRSTLDAAMLAATASQVGNPKPKRGHNAAGLSSQTDNARHLRLRVFNGSDAALGGCTVEAPAQTSLMRVEIGREMDGESVTNHTGNCVLPMNGPASMNITILPAICQDCFELWSSGVLSDEDVLQRMGRAGLEAFRDRWIADAVETMAVSPVTSDENGQQA